VSHCVEWSYIIQVLLILADRRQATVTTSLYKFIKRYPTALITLGTVDLAAKYVYVAARNPVFGLNLLPRSRFRATPQVNSQKLGL
jgi:hypothetical protein